MKVFVCLEMQCLFIPANLHKERKWLQQRRVPPQRSLLLNLQLKKLQLKNLQSRKPRLSQQPRKW